MRYLQRVLLLMIAGGILLGFFASGCGGDTGLDCVVVDGSTTCDDDDEGDFDTGGANQ